MTIIYLALRLVLLKKITVIFNCSLGFDNNSHMAEIKILILLEIFVI